MLFGGRSKYNRMFPARTSIINVGATIMASFCFMFSETCNMLKRIPPKHLWPWIQQLIDIWRTFSGRRSELESLGQYCYLLFPAISRIFPVCNSKYFPSPKHDIAISKLILWESSMTCCHSYLERSSHAAASNKYSISFPLDLKLAFLQISFKKTLTLFRSEETFTRCEHCE